ncbi:hypothetical protein ACHAW6_006944 [Cyclotella cf. meneghiniana]
MMSSSSRSTIRQIIVTRNKLFFGYLAPVMERSPNEACGSNGDDTPHDALNSSQWNRSHRTVTRYMTTTNNSSSGDKEASHSRNSTGWKSDGPPNIENSSAKILTGDNRIPDIFKKSKIRDQDKTFNRTRGNTSSTAVNIETSNFQCNFHKKIARAAKYKVHAPNCTCPKVKALRERYMVSLHSTPRQPKDGQFESSAEDNATNSSSYNGSILFDIDGTISQQFHKKLQVSEPDYTTNTPKQEYVDSGSIFDNLIVIPDTQRPSAMYVCKETSSGKFAENGTACELKLSMEIFGSTLDSTIRGFGDWPSFKVSCAICLLTSHYSNGFVAIVSDSLNQVQPFVQRARNAAEANLEKGLHSDHAHFVCALEIPSLQSLLQSGKTRSGLLQCKMHILTQMHHAGVKLSTEVEPFVGGGENSIGQNFDILLGHHLSSLLQIIAVRCPNKTLTISSDRTTQLQYIMIIGYQDGPFQWTLDLPGGKRHLGESTLEGAIRELEEECSLRLDRKWVEALVPLKYGGGASSYDSLSNESPRVMSGGFAHVFETSGDAFIMIIPST